MMKKEEVIELLRNEGYWVCKSGGNSIQVKCIFHREQKPSLTFYFDTGRFYCFGCKKTGKIEDLLRIITGKEIEIKVKKNQTIKEKQDFSDIYTKFILFLWEYNKHKPEEEALNYLKKERLLEEKTIEIFKICYIPEHKKRWQEVKKFLIQNWDIPTLKKAGFFYEKKNQLAFLKHRIIIPIWKNYKVVGISGRYFYKGETEPKKWSGKERNEGKYKMTTLSVREKILFNEDCLKYLQKGDKVILVEGLFDTILTYQEMVLKEKKWLGVVGLISNTAYDDNTIKKLKDFELYLWLDNDKAGRETEKDIMEKYNKLKNFNKEEGLKYWDRKHLIGYPKDYIKDPTDYFKYLKGEK